MVTAIIVTAINSYLPLFRNMEIISQFVLCAEAFFAVKFEWSTFLASIQSIIWAHHAQLTQQDCGMLS